MAAMAAALAAALVALLGLVAREKMQRPPRRPPRPRALRPLRPPRVLLIQGLRLRLPRRLWIQGLRQRLRCFLNRLDLHPRRQCRFLQDLHLRLRCFLDRLDLHLQCQCLHQCLKFRVWKFFLDPIHSSCLHLTRGTFRSMCSKRREPKPPTMCTLPNGMLPNSRGKTH